MGTHWKHPIKILLQAKIKKILKVQQIFGNYLEIVFKKCCCFFFQKNKDKMSSLSEQPCYTLINIPSDAEPPTEIQLKTDLGK